MLRDAILVNLEVQSGLIWWRGKESNDISVPIQSEQVELAGFFDGKDSAPDKDQGSSNFGNGREKAFGYVWEDAD